MQNKLIILLIIFGFLFLLSIASNIFLISKNRALDKAFKALEIQIVEKEEVIKNLRQELTNLTEQQALLEKQITRKKLEKDKIRKSVENITDIEVLCYEFKKAGFNPTCR